LKANGTVGFVLDQYAGPPVGIRVPVFGIPVGTQSALALLVKRTESVVLPVSNYWDEKLKKQIVEISGPVEWIQDENPDQELGLNTQNYAKQVEKAILAHPEQWLWVHRRFKGDLTPMRLGEWEQGRARK